MERLRLPVLVLACWCLLAGGASLGGCGSRAAGPSGPAVQVGVDWSRVADGGGALFSSPGKSVMVTDVCAGGPGLVAVGYSLPYDPADRDPVEPNDFPCTLEVWTSEDGAAWTRLGDEAFTGGASRRLEKEYGREALWDEYGTAEPRVVSGPAGLLAVCGLHIFKSADGLSWSEVRGVPAFEGVTLEMNTASGRRPFDFAADFFVDVIHTGSGYVASISSDTHMHGGMGWMPGPSLWTSPDGEDWSLVPLEYVELFGLENVEALAAGGPGLVAVGRKLSDARAWTGTPDASAWAASPGVLAEDARPFGLAPGGPGLVAVGRVGSYAAGVTTVTGVIWTSADGTEWARAAVDGSLVTDAEIYAVAPWASGMVAAGTAHLRETVPNQPLIAYSSAAAWTSQDGRSWSRALLPHVDEESRSSEAAAGVASFPGGLVAVGHEMVKGQPVRGVIWTSLGAE